MTFGEPGWLLCLLLLPLIWWLRRQGWGKPEAVYFPEALSVKAVFHGGRRPGSGWSEKIRMLILAILFLAAARPQLVHSVQKVTSSGLDIILAIDISGSMTARDFEPFNRLEAAKNEIRAFVGNERNNRLGLVAFAAQAFTVCPLTLDYHVLTTLLEHLQVGMTSDGTAIGMAIATCTNRLKDSTAKSKVVILLTDGRNNSGRVDPMTAAEIAAALHVRIYTIGMGQPGGAPIMIKNAAGMESALLNADGTVYREAIDEEILQQIARATGGLYFRAVDKKKLKAIYDQIREMEQARLHSKKFITREEAGHWLILVALILLLAELVLAKMLAPSIP